MGDLIWIIFLGLVGLLVISLLWLIWRLRNFSQSHQQTILDDRLLQNMLGDEALSKDVKSALAKQSAGVSAGVAEPIESDSVDSAMEEQTASDDAPEGHDSSEREKTKSALQEGQTEDDN
ncbi:MAG: hypothetical protein ACL93V_16925 [Candidatus Electrothrix sp. YB6]